MSTPCSCDVGRACQCTRVSKCKHDVEVEHPALGCTPILMPANVQIFQYSHRALLNDSHVYTTKTHITKMSHQSVPLKLGLEKPQQPSSNDCWKKLDSGWPTLVINVLIKDLDFITARDSLCKIRLIGLTPYPPISSHYSTMKSTCCVHQKQQFACWRNSLHNTEGHPSTMHGTWRYAEPVPDILTILSFLSCVTRKTDSAAKTRQGDTSILT